MFANRFCFDAVSARMLCVFSSLSRFATVLLFDLHRCTARQGVSLFVVVHPVFFR